MLNCLTQLYLLCITRLLFSFFISCFVCLFVCCFFFCKQELYFISRCIAFADLHPVFANKFLHCVDSDTILICEAYNVVAEKTASIIKDPALLKTPKAYDFISNLDTDKFYNITLDLRTQENNVHKLTLNSKITGHGKFSRKCFCDFYFTTKIKKNLHGNFL